LAVPSSICAIIKIRHLVHRKEITMIKVTYNFIKSCALTLGVAFMITLGLNANSVARADDLSEAQSMVYKAKGTLIDMTNDKLFSWLDEYIKKAKGVVIFPQIVKGGFFLGGSGGTGVFMARDRDTGIWSNPAFYTLGSVTFGLQIGGEASEVIMLAMSQKAVNSLLSTSVKLGGDVSVAVGPVGGGAKGALGVPEVTADFVSFTRTKGLYAGLNLEGSILGVRTGLNEAFYKPGTLPIDIVVMKRVTNPHADELRAVLDRITGVQAPKPVNLENAKPPVSTQ
jgi:lipid-binding SYLF domain-containing protein